MYQIIDENENRYNFDVNKITKESLGLRPTNDFAEFANNVIYDEVPDEVEKWNNKGAIGVLEAGKMYADEFNGIYENTYTENMQKDNFLLNHPKLADYSKSIDNRIHNNLSKKQERNKRVNEGTATFFERTGAFLDRLGNSQLQGQIEAAQKNADMQMPNKNNPDYKYEITGADKAGNPLYSEIDLKSKIGFLEGVSNSIGSGDFIPFAGGHIKSKRKEKVLKIKDKIYNGEEITQEELNFFNRYRLEEYEKQVRGYSAGGAIGEQWLPNIFNFGVEMWAGGAALGAVKLAGSGKALGGVVTSGLNALNTNNKIAKGTGFLVGETTEALLNSAVGGTMAGTLGGEFWAGYNERRLNDTIKITDRGTVIFSEAQEKPATAFLKSMLGTYLSFFTEGMGNLLGAGIVRPIEKGIGEIAKKSVTNKAVMTGVKQFENVIKNCPKLKGFIENSSSLLAKAYEKINGLPIKGESSQWLKNKVKFDGFLEEIGEELLEDVLSLTLGINNQEKSLENYIKAVFKTPEEWAILAGSIGLQGGTLSLAGNLLAHSMQQSGIPEDKIVEVAQNSTENEKLELIDEVFKNGTLSKRKLTDEQKQKRQEVEQKVYDKFTQGGKVENEQAFGLSKLFGIFYKNYATENNEAKKRFDNWFNKFDVRYNVPVENTLKGGVVYNQDSAEIAGAKENETEEAKKEWEEKGTESKYFKKWFGSSKVVDENGKPLVVYHGSPNEFEIFDSDKNLYGEVSKGFNFFTNKKSAYQNSAKDYADFAGTNGYNRHGKVYETYLSIQKPLHIQYTSNAMTVYNGGKQYATPVEYYDSNYKEIKDEFENGDYDGIIIENTDKNNDDSVIYLVLNSEQIKSVDNQGTFDENNPNIYYQGGFSSIVNRITQKIDNIKTIIKGKKISELANEFEFFNLFADELKDAQDYYIENLPESFKSGNTRGKHIGSSKIIYINFEAIGDDFIKFIGTLAHEAEHAKQEKEYKQAKAKKNKTKKDWEIIRNYNFCKEANGNKEKFFKENKKILEKIFEDIHGLNKSQKNEYLTKLSENDYNIYIEHAELYDKYYSTNNEIEARKAGSNAKEKAKSFNSRDFEITQSSYGIFRKRYAGTRLRDSFKETQNAGYQKGNGRNNLTNYQLESNTNNNKRISLQSANDTQTFYQEINEDGKELIAGYTRNEVMNKLIELNEQFSNEPDENKQNEILAKIHILEDAIEINVNPEKYNQEQVSDGMVNAYYVMTNQEIPKSYIEADSKSARSYNDYKELHNKRKEKRENEYYGYFAEGTYSNIITIMENANASTALHELGHLFYNGLEELSHASEEAKKQLEAVNKHFGIAGTPTTAQMERFARSFEAYLYKGKAPNNTLRQVFQNFKEWLRAVYEDITNLQNKDADISPEVQELFDRMFSDDEYYQERKEANELLEKVKSVSKKKQVKDVPAQNNEELDETAKRHKEASYQILSEGTGKSVKYLKTIFEGNAKGSDKKRQAIEELIDKTEDKIAVSGGLRKEWAEFYSDTGVNYETDEVGGSYELVRQALETIKNQSWNNRNYENELDERAKYFERAIDEADKEYKILLASYEKGNRNVALSAIYEWLESLDSEIREDYEDKFIYDSGIIERNENIDKFDKAKRQIIKKALELENQFGINSNEKYQETVKEIMKNLNFLQPQDKARMTLNILDTDSTGMLMARIDSIMDIAKTMEDIRLRRKLEADIHKELQGTKNVKKNGRTVGKYDYKTNKLFEELRELDKLTPEKANDLRLEASKFTSAEDNGLTFKDKLINKFLSYKAGGRTYEDTELMKEIYDDILKVKLAGKSAKSEFELNEKLDESKDVDELIKIVQNKKEANFALKGYVNLVANLESTLNALFNNDIKETYGSEILYAETQSQAWQHEQKQKFEKEVAKIYKLPEWCWDKKIIEYLGEKHTYPEIRRKYNEKGELVKARNIDRTLTKMDIIQAYIWSKNEILEQRLINQFGADTLENMFDELSLEDVKLAEVMMETVQSFYPLVNRTFINKYGLDLPKVSCYFPSTPERGSEVDLYNDYSSKSLNNSFTKNRAMSQTQPMDFHNPVATLYNHIDGVSKFVFMSESLDRANLRFKNNDLRLVIINKFGEDAYKTLEQALMNVTYKKEAPVFNGMNKIIDNMVGNWIQANVAIKPIVGLKQLLSANNYAVDMPYLKWQAGFLKALAHPKETIDYIMKIPYIKARYEGSFSNEFLKQTVENSAFAMSKKLKDLCNVFIKMGDIGAIIFGGKPYIDYLIKEKGMSEEEAIKQFILSTNRSQQSSAISSLSNFQVNMTRHPMGKLFIAFKNSPQQYIRMCGDAIVSAANGDISKKQCAKLLFQFGYLQPFLYAIATSGSILRFLFTGDDDDLMKDAAISIFNFGSDALPLIGDIYKYALNRIGYKEKYLPQTTPLLGDIESEINKISKEDVSVKDYLEAISYLGLHVGLGYNSKAIINMGSGVGDIAGGNIAKGSMKLIGYTDKRSKKITEE